MRAMREPASGIRKYNRKTRREVSRRQERVSFKQVFVRGLSPLQMRAVDEYFVNGYDRRLAAKAVGYKSYQNLFDKPEVVAEIKRRVEAINKRYEVDADWIAQQYVKIAMSDIGDLLVIDEATGKAFYDLRKLDHHHRAAIKSFVVETYNEGRGPNAVEVKKHKIEFHDKLAALNALARMQGMFNDRMTVTHELTIVDALQAGRERLGKRRQKVIEADFEEVAEDE